MSGNDFFNYDPDAGVQPFTLARAEAISAVFQAVEDGFTAVQKALVAGGTVTPPVSGSPEELHLKAFVFVHLMRPAAAATDIEAFDAAMSQANLRNLPVAFLYGAGVQGGRYVIQRAGQNQNLSDRGNIYGKGVTIMSFGPKKAEIIITSVDRGLQPYIFFGNPVGVGTLDAPSIIEGSDPTGIENLTILNLIFRGNVVEGGHSEQNALLHLNAAKNVLIKGCEFRDFPGDGLYGGSGDLGGGGQVRHNENWLIEDCLFDGGNKNNRNGISGIDMTNMVIRRCVFRNCTKPGGPGDYYGDPFNPATGIRHPGNIDFEPNVFFKPDGTVTASYRHIRMANIVVQGNDFADGGSNAVALFLVANQIGDVKIDRPVRGFLVEDNLVQRMNGCVVSTFGDESDTVGLDIVVRNNRGYNLVQPIALRGARITVDDNIFADCETAGTIGFITAGGQYGGVRDLRLRRNQFTRVGNLAGGLIINRIDSYGLIEGNTFLDNAFSAITFVGNESLLCVIDGLDLRNNRFLPPTPGAAKNQAYAIARLTFAGTPKINTLTCKAEGNEFNGLDTFDQATNGQVMIPGLEVGVPPAAGDFRRGARLYGRNPAPGEPEYWWNAYASTTASVGNPPAPIPPTWKAVAAPGALPDPAGDSSVSAALTQSYGAMTNDGAGRFTATADGNNFQFGNAEIANVGFEWLAVPSGASSVYLGFMKASRLVGGHPVNLSSINHAIWQVKGEMYLTVDGALSTYLGSGYELGMKMRAKINTNGTLTIWKTDPRTGIEQQIHQSGVTSGSFIPVVLIVAKDGTVRISKVTNS